MTLRDLQCSPRSIAPRLDLERGHRLGAQWAASSAGLSREPGRASSLDSPWLFGTAISQRISTPLARPFLGTPHTTPPRPTQPDQVTPLTPAAKPGATDAGDEGPGRLLRDRDVLAGHDDRGGQIMRGDSVVSTEVATLRCHHRPLPERASGDCPRQQCFRSLRLDVSSQTTSF